MPCPVPASRRCRSGPWLATARGAEAAGHALSGDRPARARLPRDRAAGTGRAAARHRPACWCRWWAPNTPWACCCWRCRQGWRRISILAATIGDAMVIALDRARAADELALHREVRDLDGDLCARRRLDAHADARARGDVSGRRAADGGRRRGSLAPRSARARAGADGDLGPAPPPVDAARARPRIRTRRWPPRCAAIARSWSPAPAPTRWAPMWAWSRRLRGRRRALGVLAVHGVRLEPGGEMALLDRASRDRPPAVGDPRKRPAARRRVAIARGTGQRLQFAHRPGGRHRRRRPHRRGQSCLCGASGPAARRARRPGAQRPALPCAGRVDRARHATRPRQPSAPSCVRWTTRGLGGTFDLTLTPLGGPGSRRPAAWCSSRAMSRSQSRLEAERALLERRLGQSEKLLALGQFVAGVAHELNNPLQGVLGHLELLRASRDAAGAAAARPGAGLPRSRPRRAHRPQPARLRGLGPSAPPARGHQRRRRARPAFAGAGAQGARRIEVRRDLADALPKVKGDGLLLQQALLNLVLNAEQAMAGAGSAGGPHRGDRKRPGARSRWTTAGRGCRRR